MRKRLNDFVDDGATREFLRDLMEWGEDAGETTAAADAAAAAKAAAKASASAETEGSSPYYNLFRFINEYIQNMTSVFPGTILAKASHDGAASYAAAKRMGLSRNAIDAINANVSADYAGLEAFYEEPSIANVLSSVASRCSVIGALAAHTPYFTEITNGGEKIVSVLDKTTCKMLF